MTPDITQENKKLLLQKEYLRKEFSDLYTQRNEMMRYEESYLTALYLDTIGKRQHTKFSLGVDINMIKQRIGLIQAFLNRNEIPDLMAIDQEIKKRFAEYQKKIDDQAAELKRASDYLKEKFLPEDMVLKMKETYRLIVKRLHPDLNDNLTEHEKDLFVQAQAAYETCNTDMLNQILLSLKLDDTTPVTSTDLKTYVDKLLDNVAKLKEQIAEMEKKFPFSFRDKLLNPDWVATEQKVLDIAIAELTHEKEKLSEYMLLLQAWKPVSLN